MTQEEEVARKANMKLTQEEEVALYGEHRTLKAFYPTAVERLISQTQLKNFHTILDIIAII